MSEITPYDDEELSEHGLRVRCGELRVQLAEARAELDQARAEWDKERKRAAAIDQANHEKFLGVVSERDNLLDAAPEGGWMARALDAERDRNEARAVLKLVELGDDSRCPVCKREWTTFGHSTDCRLAKVLRDGT